MSIIASNSPDFSTTVGAAINAGAGIEVDLVSGAIAINRGTVLITKATAAAMTLALPVAGTDDGKSLRVVSTTAAAHTVTTPATGLNGSHIATFAAAIGNAIELVAYNGTWYTVASIGITIT